MMEKSPVARVSDDRIMAASFAPRWTVQSVGWAVAVTLGLFLLLPLLEGWSTREEQARLMPHSVESVHLPPPEPEPVEPLSGQASRRTLLSATLPRWQEPQRRLQPSPIPVDLQLVLAPGAGDFTVDFPVDSALLLGPREQLVFEIAQLDEAPRPLAQLQPVYPAQARARRLNGAVTLEFVVGADGRTSGIRVISAEPGDLFTAAAVRAVEGWRFAPGKKAGRAVPARVRQTVVFQMSDSTTPGRNG